MYLQGKGLTGYELCACEQTKNNEKKREEWMSWNQLSCFCRAQYKNNSSKKEKSIRVKAYF